MISGLAWRKSFPVRIPVEYTIQPRPTRLTDPAMPHSHPIGIFDSGIGGLSVAAKVRELLPADDILYVADSRHAPYGDKSDAFILERMNTVTDFLLGQGAKAVVVACNTATTSAIAQLRASWSVPIIGVEPGVKPAVLATRSGVVGVLATPRTLQTHSFSALAARFSSTVSIEVQPCPDLVGQIEALRFDDDRTLALLNRYISPLLEKGADTIVLGCTHYNYLADRIAQVAGPGVQIVSTESAVAREVVRRLACEGLLAESGKTGDEAFYTSGELAVFARQIDCLWGPGKAVYSL